MKYFTPKALRSYEGYDSARESYWQHIKEIRLDLPSALFDLHNNYSLHDAEISSVTEVHGSDLVMVLDGCRNGALADTDRVLYVLHFMGAGYSKRRLMNFIGSEVLYVEITSGDDRKWKFSASTTRDSRNDEIAIQFNDFGFYLHDYRTGP